MAEKVEGLAEAYALFGQLPDAAEYELGVEMAIIGREILAAQHADVAKLTGALDAALALQLLLDRLKIRVGLLAKGGRGRRAGQGGPFYGRFVEFGRSAQTVVVTRRIKKRRARGNSKNGNTRRIEYQGASTRLRRRGPNKGTPIGSPYKLRVRVRQAHPFVAQPLLQEAADLHLSDYWAKVLALAGDAA